MSSWLSQNIVGIIGIVFGGVTAYHVYFLSQKLDLKDRLTHRDSIRNQVESILVKIRAGGASKAELINVKKYHSHYPTNNNQDKDGYTYVGAELKSLRFDGVEFFCSIREVYKDLQGNLSLEGGAGFVKEAYNAFEAGVIPYEWIDYVDMQGDEFSYRPQFFTKFIGIEKYPYKKLVYYKKSETYQKESDPMDMQWKIIEMNK